MEVLAIKLLFDQTLIIKMFPFNLIIRRAVIIEFGGSVTPAAKKPLSCKLTN